MGMSGKLLRPKGSSTPVFTEAGYTRLWCVTDKSTGNVTGTAESDTGFYAVKWWDNTTTVYESGDTFSKSAGGRKAFEIFPSDTMGDPEGQFDGFDISDNALTQVRAEDVSLFGTAGVPGYWGNYWWAWNPATPASYEGGTISKNSLSATALDQFYADLDAGGGRLFVDRNPGIGADAPTIATTKGYTVFGSVPPQTTVLLPFDSNFDDATENAPIPSYSGDVFIDASVKKYGAGSLRAEGGYLEFADSPAFDINYLEPFTIEMWLRINARGEGYTTVATKRINYGADWQWLVGFSNPATANLYFSANSDGGPNQIFDPTEMDEGVWYHYAIVGASGTVKMYRNGAEVASGPFTSQPNNGQPVTLGALFGGGEPFDGNIDDFRVVKNATVYTANFTPPTGPLGVYP
jgi:hypothetical protein